MNPTKLRHAVAVDRTGSITAASQMLNVTQSTVTKSVAEIELEVGFALFDRKARGVTVTDEGREFINRAARIISDLDQLLEDAQAQRQTLETVFRVAVCPPSIEGLLNRAVLKLIKDQPDLRLHLNAVPVERGIRLLRRGDVDALVGPELTLSTETDFKYETLTPMQAVLFARKGHPLAQKAHVKRRDLVDYPVISPDTISPATDQLSQILLSVGAEPRRQMHVIENFPLVTDIVASTDIIAVVSAGYAVTRAFQRRFKILKLDVFDTMPLCCAYRARWLPNKSTLAFIRALETHPPAGLGI